MEQTSNTFNKGLLMDTHPMVQGNDTLTNALNATFITKKGNEVILQNDMGNRRVDFAFLPPGYVPVGMKEYGGIIYVASYNPITLKGQVGSFPSPERNISSLGDDDTIISFGFNTYSENELCFLVEETNVYRLYLDYVFHVGDKYTIYNSAIWDTENGEIVGKKYLTNFMNTYVENLKNIFPNYYNNENILSYINNITNILDIGLTHFKETDSPEMMEIKQSIRENKYKIYSPKNKEYTLSIGVLDENQFKDITKTLRRFNYNILLDKINDNEDLNFNTGYFINGLPEEVSIVDKERSTIGKNLYINKISSPICIKVEHNYPTSFSYSIYGTKNNETYNLKVTGTLIYNCPDNATKSNDKSDKFYSFFTESAALQWFHFLSEKYGRTGPNGYQEYFVDDSTKVIADIKYIEDDNLYIAKITKNYNNVAYTRIEENGDHILDYFIGVTKNLTEDYSCAYNPYIRKLSYFGSINLDNLNLNNFKVDTWKFNTENNITTVNYGFSTNIENFEGGTIILNEVNGNESVSISFRETNGSFILSNKFGKAYRVTIDYSEGTLNNYWILCTTLFNGADNSGVGNNYCFPSETSQKEKLQELLTVTLNLNFVETLTDTIECEGDYNESNFKYWLIKDIEEESKITINRTYTANRFNIPIGEGELSIRNSDLYPNYLKNNLTINNISNINSDNISFDEQRIGYKMLSNTEISNTDNVSPLNSIVNNLKLQFIQGKIYFSGNVSYDWKFVYNDKSYENSNISVVTMKSFDELTSNSSVKIFSTSANNGNRSLYLGTPNNYSANSIVGIDAGGNPYNFKPNTILPFRLPKFYIGENNNIKDNANVVIDGVIYESKEGTSISNNITNILNNINPDSNCYSIEESRSTGFRAELYEMTKSDIYTSSTSGLGYFKPLLRFMKTRKNKEDDEFYAPLIITDSNFLNTNDNSFIDWCKYKLDEEIESSKFGEVLNIYVPDIETLKILFGITNSTNGTVDIVSNESNYNYVLLIDLSNIKLLNSDSLKISENVDELNIFNFNITDNSNTTRKNGIIFKPKTGQYIKQSGYNLVNTLEGGKLYVIPGGITINEEDMNDNETKNNIENYVYVNSPAVVLTKLTKNNKTTYYYFRLFTCLDYQWEGNKYKTTVVYNSFTKDKGFFFRNSVEIINNPNPDNPGNNLDNYSDNKYYRIYSPDEYGIDFYDGISSLFKIYKQIT